MYQLQGRGEVKLVKISSNDVFASLDLIFCSSERRLIFEGLCRFSFRGIFSRVTFS